MGRNSCEVTEAWWGNVVDACNCQEINDVSCQLKLEVVPTVAITCKSNTSQECKNSVFQWANAYKNATNANDCKDEDPNYNASQGTASSCA